MEHKESYRSVAITINTSELASGRYSFVVYLDGRLMTAEIDGLDNAHTLDIALKQAKAYINRQIDK